MDQETNTILDKQIALLPQELKTFIAEGSWLTAVRDITTKNSFSPEQTAELENEVTFVIIGMRLKADLRQNIERDLDLDPAVASTISASMEERIFRSIEALLPTEIESLELESPHDMLLPPNLPTKTPLEQKLGSLTPEGTAGAGEKKSWEERKKALGESRVIADYKGKDPYREAIE